MTPRPQTDIARSPDQRAAAAYAEIMAPAWMRYNEDISRAEARMKKATARAKRASDAILRRAGADVP